MIRLLCAAVLAVGFAMPACAEPHGPPCQGLDASRIEAKSIAEHDGIGFVNLDDDHARRMLDFINAQGKPTSIKSDHIGVFLIPATNTAMVILDDSPCHGFHSTIRMPLKMFVEAYQAILKPADSGAAERSGI